MDRQERSRLIDARIDELLQDLEERQRTSQNLANSPELRMVHDIRRAYQAEAFEDSRSLERVLTKLKEDQAKTQTEVLFLPHVSRQPERISTLQHRLDILARGKSSSWQQRAGLLAAVVLLALLVGGLLTGLGVIHAGPASPTPTLASDVITSVNLSDSANQAPPVQHFTVGQTIWLVINVGKKEATGILTVKWYENDSLYATSTRDFQTSKGQAVTTALKIIPVRIHQVYRQPGEGKVELYWNGQLVKTLHFVVK